ncbi:MAG: hypothetical protein GXP19_02945 [Gammaproteobacteria bacterium]|nr:hypothetical protein [Gammaproteobacteria bacterium]
MVSTNIDLLVLACTWILYFLLHSLLASLGVKQWVAQKYPFTAQFYRAGYNIFAIVLIIPPLWLMYFLGGAVVWEWKGIGSYFSNALGTFAVIGFLWSLRYYDGMAFLGLRQIKSKNANVEDQEQFCISPLHRLVRHPWYFLAIVFIWSRDMDTAFLVSSVCITLYFIVGSWFEERKLAVYHGDMYRRYQRYVPGVLPVPWRYLNKEKLDDVRSLK